MDESPNQAHALRPSTAQAIHSLIGTARNWLDSWVHLVALEAKIARIDLALILGFGLCASVLLITGWLALLGTLIAALVEHDILGWIGALLVVALLNLAGAAGLVFFAIKRSRQLLFTATRRQLGLKVVASSGHE